MVCFVFGLGIGLVNLGCSVFAGGVIFLLGRKVVFLAVRYWVSYYFFEYELFFWFFIFVDCEEV